MDLLLRRSKDNPDQFELLDPEGRCENDTVGEELLATFPKYDVALSIKAMIEGFSSIVDRLDNAPDEDSLP